MSIWSFFNPRETNNEQHRQSDQAPRDSAPAQHPTGDPGGAQARALGVALAKQAIFSNPYTSYPGLTQGLANQAALQGMSGQLPAGAPQGLGYGPALGGMNAAQSVQWLPPLGLLPQRLLEEPPAPLPREKPAFGELIGHRAWLVMGGKLLSISMGSEWIPGKTMIDECEENRFERIRDGNHAGIWSFRDPYILGREFHALVDPSASCGSKGVFGTVYLWGTVIEHERGYRAQYAAVRSLEKATPGIDLEDLRATYLPPKA